MTRQRVAAGIAGAAGLIALVTVFSRAAGFARILVFAESVRAGGVGQIYQSVNALPNVVFEVAAGGTLAAAAVPLVAHRLGEGRREHADRLASVLLTWALAVLVPLGTALFLLAGPLVTLLVNAPDAAGHAVGVTMLRVFSLQVPLYGVGIVLTGVLHAHRRFLMAALGPLLSSVVVLASYLWYGSLTGGETDPNLVPASAVAVLAWGTTLGVAVLSLPLVLPALRTGWRWQPSFRLEPEDRRRIGHLAGAGVLALVAQQSAVLVTMFLANRASAGGVFVVYGYAQAVYLLPYAVLAVPVAQSVFPALAQGHAAGADTARTVARSMRAVVVLQGVAAGVLMAAAPAVGAFFGLLDARRGADGASPEAIAALPGALLAFAPGLVGFGLVALLTRAVYVRGRPLDAALAVAGGWVLAAALPAVLAGTGASPGTLLRTVGIASTLGMTVAGLGLVVLVRGLWGPEVTTGLGRTTGAVVVAMALAVFLGDLVTHGRALDDLPETVVVGVAAGAVALLVGTLAVFYGDRAVMREIRDRGRARRRGGGDR
ncbi:virulence factor MviN [Phycicoccus sp. CSK15P-2]|uniref:murein biosynthesis integral membrane protein MurJ n=1 Tax=Phycicoccus sp. CSK15P-2 TaxID=2807627 RepID=UPI00194F4809|nr:lipid II flippase MurJ [Phycicoccus sp. CSK15P-2]MBM6403709.1 virulence factor MviN [Phycicoccus sp. CSK15P-2]